MNKIELTKQDIEDFKLNLTEMEEQIDELNTSIKALYHWTNRTGLKIKKKQTVIKLSDSG